MNDATYAALQAMGAPRDFSQWAWGEQTRVESDWKQVSGDVTASVWGATFARTVTETDQRSDETRAAVELVKVYNFEVDSGENMGDADEYGPYYVETYTLEPWMMGTSEAMQYHEKLDELRDTLRDDVDPLDALTLIADHIGDYGYFEQSSVYGGQLQTLGAAMDSQHIPQAALWRPEEYTTRVQWGGTCKLMPLEYIHPRTNHLAVLATEAMRLVDAGENTSDIVTHMARVAESIVKHGDELPEWYANYHDQPCDGWRNLDTF